MTTASIAKHTFGSKGLLIINADDWGRDRHTTNCILECASCRAVSSVSAMVFMEDSERGAALAREQGIDAGLHLNFTTPFSGACRRELRDRQERIANRLLRHRFSQAVFHPDLVRSFAYVVSAQLDEYHRLYGAPPARLDGHHHMHLCLNVLLSSLLPAGTVVRRNNSFSKHDKAWVNRWYRLANDHLLALRHCSTDYFFSLTPLRPDRVNEIFSLAKRFTVEVETHPVNREEYEFLMASALARSTGAVSIAPDYSLHAVRG